MSDRAAKAARARKQLRRHQELQRQKLAEAESGAPAPPAGDSPSRPVTAGPPRGPPPRASTANDPESAQGGLSHTPRVPVVPPVVPSAADGAAPPGALDADKPAPPPSSAPLSDEAPSAAAPPETQSSQQPGAFASAAELWGTSDGGGGDVPDWMPPPPGPSAAAPPAAEVHAKAEPGPVPPEAEAPRAPTAPAVPEAPAPGADPFASQEDPFAGPDPFAPSAGSVGHADALFGPSGGHDVFQHVGVQPSTDIWNGASAPERGQDTGALFGSGADLFQYAPPDHGARAPARERPAEQPHEPSPPAPAPPAEAPANEPATPAQTADALFSGSQSGTWAASEAAAAPEPPAPSAPVHDDSGAKDPSRGDQTGSLFGEPPKELFGGHGGAPLAEGEAPFTGGEPPFTGGEEPLAGGEAPFTGGEAPLAGGEAPFSGGQELFSGGDAADQLFGKPPEPAPSAQPPTTSVAEQVPEPTDAAKQAPERVPAEPAAHEPPPANPPPAEHKTAPAPAATTSAELNTAQYIPDGAAGARGAGAGDVPRYGGAAAPGQAPGITQDAAFAEMTEEKPLGAYHHPEFAANIELPSENPEALVEHEEVSTDIHGHPLLPIREAAGGDEGTRADSSTGSVIDLETVLHGELQHARARLSSLEQERATLHEETRVKTERVASLDRELSETALALSSTRSELSPMEDRNNELFTQLTHAQQSVREISDKHSMLERECAAAREEAAQLRTELHELHLRGPVASEDQRVARLEQENRQLRAEMHELRTLIERMQQSQATAHLQHEVATLRDQLNQQRELISSEAQSHIRKLETDLFNETSKTHAAQRRILELEQGGADAAAPSELPTRDAGASRPEGALARARAHRRSATAALLQAPRLSTLAEQDSASFAQPEPPRSAPVPPRSPSKGSMERGEQLPPAQQHRRAASLQVLRARIGEEAADAKHGTGEAQAPQTQLPTSVISVVGAKQALDSAAERAAHTPSANGAGAARPQPSQFSTEALLFCASCRGDLIIV